MIFFGVSVYLRNKSECKNAEVLIKAVIVHADFNSMGAGFFFREDALDNRVVPAVIGRTVQAHFVFAVHIDIGTSVRRTGRSVFVGNVHGATGVSKGKCVIFRRGTGVFPTFVKRFEYIITSC